MKLTQIAGGGRGGAEAHLVVESKFVRSGALILTSIYTTVVMQIVYPTTLLLPLPPSTLKKCWYATLKGE